MIKGTNGTLGIEVVRKDDIIHFIGHFEKGLTSKMKMYVVDVQNMFDDTGTIELNRESDGVCIGLIGYEPQGTNFFFIPNQGRDLICVDSTELEMAVKEVIGV